jgi:prepilin-type N-terminal cleavage/methylation domain-containing protein
MTYDNINKNFKKSQLKKAPLKKAPLKKAPLKKAPLKKAFSLIELSVVVLIIGILIAGITAGSRLVRNSKLASAAQLTKSSDVNSIPDLVLWLEPTQENSFATTSGNTDTLTYANVAGLQDSAYVKDTLRPDNREYVARWNDISPRAVAGNKKSVYQETGSRRPMYIANAINGLPAILFRDGKFLYSLNNSTTPSAPPLPAKGTQLTYVVVFKGITNQNTYSSFLSQFVGFSQSSSDFNERGMGLITNSSTGKPFFTTWWGDLTVNQTLDNNLSYIQIMTLNGTDFKSCLNSSSCLTVSAAKKVSTGQITVANNGIENINLLSDNTFAVATRAYSGGYLNNFIKYQYRRSYGV